MQGDKDIIAFLNEQLTAELTAINQYWLHYKLQDNRGWKKLAEYTRSESIDEMKHADKLAERIIFLEGLPNFQKLFPLEIGQSVTEMFQADMKVEVAAVERLRKGIKLMRERATSPQRTSSRRSSPTRNTTSTTWRRNWT